MLDPRLIALDGVGGDPRHLAVRGLWPLDSVEPPVYVPGTGPAWEPRKKRKPEVLTGYAEVEILASAAGAGGMVLSGAAATKILAEAAASGRLVTRGKRIRARAYVGTRGEARAALRASLRAAAEIRAEGRADENDLEMVEAILLLIESGDL